MGSYGFYIKVAGWSKNYYQIYFNFRICIFVESSSFTGDISSLKNSLDHPAFLMQTCQHFEKITIISVFEVLICKYCG